MKILVLGWYGKRNIGDNTYEQTFRTLFPKHTFEFVTRLEKAKVDECDAIVLGGGNVLRKAFIEELAKYPQKKIFGFSVGMEEVPSQDLSFFKHIYTRDYKTLDYLKSANISCSFIPDAALILEGDAANGKKWIESAFKREDNKLNPMVIGIVVNSYMCNGNLSGLAREAMSFLKFSYDLASIIDDTPASFLFLPFGCGIPTDDRVTNAWIASKCKYWKKNHMCFEELSTQTALDAFAACNMVISSRLHSSIFSFVSGTPFLDITHHSKNELFLRLINKEENSVSFWNFDSKAFRIKLQKIMQLPKHTEHTHLRELVWNKVNEISFD